MRLIILLLLVKEVYNEQLYMATNKSNPYRATPATIATNSSTRMGFPTTATKVVRDLREEFDQYELKEESAQYNQDQSINQSQSPTPQKKPTCTPGPSSTTKPLHFSSSPQQVPHSSAVPVAASLQVPKSYLLAMEHLQQVVKKKDNQIMNMKIQLVDKEKIILDSESRINQVLLKYHQLMDLYASKQVQVQVLKAQVDQLRIDNQVALKQAAKILHTTTKHTQPQTQQKQQQQPYPQQQPHPDSEIFRQHGQHRQHRQHRQHGQHRQHRQHRQQQHIRLRRAQKIVPQIENTPMQRIMENRPHYERNYVYDLGYERDHIDVGERVGDRGQGRVADNAQLGRRRVMSTNVLKSANKQPIKKSSKIQQKYPAAPKISTKLYSESSQLPLVTDPLQPRPSTQNLPQYPNRTLTTLTTPTIPKQTPPPPTPPPPQHPLLSQPLGPSPLVEHGKVVSNRDFISYQRQILRNQKQLIALKYRMECLQRNLISHPKQQGTRIKIRKLSQEIQMKEKLINDLKLI